MTAREFPQRHPKTAFRSIGDDGGLVVLPGRSEVKVLNPVAIKIFSLLDGAHSRKEIAAAIVDEFEINAEEAERDLDAFLAELEAHGMLATPATAATPED